LKSKTWIDWIKVVIAVDIAGVGIGLILNFEDTLHVFANIFGFVSHIIFGILYIFVAVLIFKRVFPQDLAQEEKDEALRTNDDIFETTNSVKKAAQKIIKKVDHFSKETYHKIDGILDKSEDFFDKRKQEVKDEVGKIME